MISAFSTDMGVLPQLAVRRAGIARPLDGLPEVGMNCGDSICASDTPRSASATTSLIRRQLARTLHESSMPQLPPWRSEEHTSELQSLMRISYAVFCLKKKNDKNTTRKKTKRYINNNKTAPN